MYIRDKISEVRDDFSWGFFDIINYHRFFNQQINSLGIAFDIPEEIKNDDEKRNAFIDRYYYSNESVFEGCDISHKYQTILIDEIQDYKAEWIKIIRNYFLADEGEMVLIGDEKQNIYERELENDRTSRTVQGFRRWQVLTKCYRSASDSPLVNLAKEFQSVYFSGIYEGDFDPNEQLQISNLDIKECLVYNPRNIRSLIQYIFETARKKHIHPNDITILASRIDTLREIDYFIRNDIEFNEKTLTTFETKEELPYLPSKKDIEKLRANRKYGFNLNSGVVKLSTIHSFKGYESPTVFLILDDRDNAELVYVGITRAKINLIVFVDANSRYRSFFEQRLDCVTLRTHIAVR